MTQEEILEKITIAIRTLFSNDIYLFEQSLNERTITHKLAEYLQPLFVDYNVDCEYNGDYIEKRKKIYILEKKLKDINREANKNDVYSIYPDIIIHKRGCNDHNLAVIEVKKYENSSRYEELKKFDLLKLEALTTDDGNYYKYRLGIALVFNTGKDKNIRIQEDKYFKSGKEIQVSKSIKKILAT